MSYARTTISASTKQEGGRGPRGSDQEFDSAGYSGCS